MLVKQFSHLSLGHFHQRSLFKLVFKVDGRSFIRFLSTALAFTVSLDIIRTPALSSQLEENMVPFSARDLHNCSNLKQKCCPLLSREHTAKVHIFIPPSFPDYSLLGCELSSRPRMGLEIRIKYFKSWQFQNKQNRPFWRVVVCGLARRKE